jgi:hypothetical protein
LIKKVYPSANLDGKDDVYVEARFDAAMEDLEAGKKNDAANNAFHKDGFVPKNTDTGKPDEYNADAARERMMERMRKDSRGEQ